MTRRKTREQKEPEEKKTKPGSLNMLRNYRWGDAAGGQVGEHEETSNSRDGKHKGGRAEVEKQKEWKGERNLNDK